MLPPILLGIQHHHWVFDMCAAPGSKTSQVIELMKSSLDQLPSHSSTLEFQKGLVVANDADNKRAYLLTHQLNRLNTSNLVILNHNAQNFPFLYSPLAHPSSSSFDSTILFDRIICDVPCSSDAAIRKIPSKWEKWQTKDGSSLHPLQI
mmetsp:Transcript_17304/g.12363  ORF Transcript_17304/g.12363 Transcript_17304/m.12363 type:complete len:149 (-) Transcript_17304:53-499(-)